MPASETLKDVDTDEIKDLWSANDQMVRALTTLNEGVHDATLKTHFAQALTGIARHNDTLKGLLQAAGAEVEKEHCKGMEGLCREALKHGLEEAPKDGELRDIVVISQYQRMCHYGITGFGSAKAYATALGLEDAAEKLDRIVSDIYGADEFTTQLGERTARLAARHSAAAA